MKIAEINYTDLPGRAFDGYDLHLELNRRGYEAYQIVKDKKSSTDTVIQIPSDEIASAEIRAFEYYHGLENMLMPTAAYLEKIPLFADADIVHFHILHNGMVSIYDYPRLMNGRKSVWTIHDPWITTGGCIHPLGCEQQKLGCKNCNQYHNAEFQYSQKLTELKKINPVIVVSTAWMKSQLLNSPVSSHFNHIEIIPFGVDTTGYCIDQKNKYRKELGISSRDIVIGFRSQPGEIKGCKYIFDALRQLYVNQNPVIITVDSGQIPADIASRFRTIELGWVDDKEILSRFLVSCDIFLMPSLAESFGLMAIEAMAAECAVICFKNTVVEEIINAPVIGIAADYKSSPALQRAIEHLVNNPEERKNRGQLGRQWVQTNYSFEDYVNRHIELYLKLKSNW